MWIGLILAAIFGLVIRWDGRAAEPKVEGAGRHPTVFITPEDMQRAKINISRYPWARQIADAVRREADSWLGRDDDWLRGVVPPPGAAFTYGLTGCPVCGAFWGPWARDAATFDRPGGVTCRNGHRLPDAAHPDSGTGYVAPDGRIHYIVGAYNAWVVETLTFKALENLVHAFTLTGDERYAAKASVILDALAAIYPSCHKGCWDYPSTPPSGRLDRPWYQASRVLIHYVDQYDQLFPSKSLDLPSVIGGMSRRQNIEENLLKDGGAYCYEQSKIGRLNNGEADYERGALAVGVCLGIPEYVRWAADGPYGIRVLLENNIGRDGDYFEVTSMYADHTRELYFTFAEPLLHYRGSAYPAGLNLYQNPKFIRYLEPHNLPIHGAGHMPRYGDAPPDLIRRDVPSRPFDRSDYDFLEKLYARTANPEIGALLSWLADGKFDWLRSLASSGDPSGLTIPDRRMSAGMSIYREPGDRLGGGFSDRLWMLFNAGAPPAATKELSQDWRRRLLASDFQGQKGMAILRAGEGENAQALLLRYGPALNHGHLDDLNINYFARGYELTYDLGYGSTAASQTQTNWSKQTASHNLVVVDEKSQREGGTTGGSLQLFADTPAVRAIEASSELSYSKQGVSVYRRVAALIGSGAETFLVDFFRVRGGSQHDWIFHAPSSAMQLAGLNAGAELAGSLAGVDISWSDKQLNDGDIQGHPNAPSWIAPPGNGYGFLIRPSRGAPPDAWSADWEIDPRTHVRVIMPATPGVEVISALAHGLYPHYPQARYLLVRRRGENLDSSFMAAIEPYGGMPGITRVERLLVDGDKPEIVPMAMKIEATSGRTDFVYSAADAAERRMAAMTVAGRLIHLRQSGSELESLTLVGGRRFAGSGWTLDTAEDGWRGVVSAVVPRGNAFTTTERLPVDGRLNDATVIFSNPGYSRTTAYRIVGVERSGRLFRVRVDGTFRLGMGRVETVGENGTLSSRIPHEYAFSSSPTGKDNFFCGKRIFTASGAGTTIRSMKPGDPLVLIVGSTSGFKPGDRFDYADVQAGDRFEILSTCTLTRTAPNQYRVGGSTAATVSSPDGTTVVGLKKMNQR